LKSLHITPAADKRSRNVLPKTGQITSYQAGDDGAYEAGWWRGRLNANNKMRFRFVNIGGDDVILDYATRLMWKATDEAGTYTWANAIIQAEGLTYAGFSDWKLPNRLELLSIINHEEAGMIMQYADFNLTPNFYWTSTTYSRGTTSAFHLVVGSAMSFSIAKTNTYCVRVCREF